MRDSEMFRSPSLQRGESRGEGRLKILKVVTMAGISLSICPFILGLDSSQGPTNNSKDPAKVELGKILYFDKRLSKDSTVSCASCHNPRMGWTDHRPTPLGIREQIGSRNAPTLLNAAAQKLFFWDGRASSLEEQAKVPITDSREMDMSPEEAVSRIRNIPGYSRYFKSAYGDSAVTFDRIVGAITSFERTLVAANSPYDRYKGGDTSALGKDAARGMKLFFGKANCAACHSGDNFTDGGFHNLGVGMQRKEPDLGRYAVTRQDKDRGAFKTPALRNLGDTFPYMHDGSQASLEEVIEFLNRGGQATADSKPELKPLRLSRREKKDLLAFLRALNGDKLIVEEPKELPK